MRRLGLALALLAAAGPAYAADDKPDPQKKEAALRKAFVAGDLSGSRANAELRKQVADELFDKERAIRPNCEPEVVSIRELSEPKFGGWMERWFVRSCFERFPYRITFQRSKDAGKDTEFEIVPDVGKHGYPVR